MYKIFYYTLTAKDPKQRFGIRRISGGLLSGGLLSGGLMSRATDFGPENALIRLKSLGVYSLGF